MAKRFYGSGKESAMVPSDRGMISENRSAMSNLPTEVIRKYYDPRDSSGMHTMPDLYDRVQQQLKSDNASIKSLMSPHKY